MIIQASKTVSGLVFLFLLFKRNNTQHRPPPPRLFLKEKLFFFNKHLKMYTKKSTWVAQSVKRQTLSQATISTLCEIEPHIRLCADSGEPAWDFLCPSVSAPSPVSLSFSVSKINKL